MWKTAANPGGPRDSHPQGVVDKFSVFHRVPVKICPQAVVNRFFSTVHSPCGEIFGRTKAFPHNRGASKLLCTPKASPVQGEVARRAGGVVRWQLHFARTSSACKRPLSQPDGCQRPYPLCRFATSPLDKGSRSLTQGSLRPALHPQCLPYNRGGAERQRSGGVSRYQGSKQLHVKYGSLTPLSQLR